jgi:hypothetical protein
MERPRPPYYWSISIAMMKVGIDRHVSCKVNSQNREIVLPIQVFETSILSFLAEIADASTLYESAKFDARTS